MHERASTHPKSCRFCGHAEFWRLYDGPVHSSGADREGRRFSEWTWYYVARCTKCHATFNAESRNKEGDGEKLEWHLGRR